MFFWLCTWGKMLPECSWESPRPLLYRYLPLHIPSCFPHTGQMQLPAAAAGSRPHLSSAHAVFTIWNTFLHFAFQSRVYPTSRHWILNFKSACCSRYSLKDYCQRTGVVPWDCSLPEHEQYLRHLQELEFGAQQCHTTWILILAPPSAV